MYPMLGTARRILSSRASNQFVGFAYSPLIYQQSPSLPALLMYLHGGMPHLNHESSITDVARNDLIMAKLLHPFWLELAGKKFCMREWMRGMHGMRGLPRPMRGGWQV